jgi:cell division protein FtsZ
LDFADVKTVMKDQGAALMGIGSANGENRTEDATKKAISSPLLEVSIDGAEQVLLNITGGPDLSLFEAQAASQIVSDAATSDVNIIFGTSIDEDLGDEVRVTVIATGIDKKKEEREAAQHSRVARRAESQQNRTTDSRNDQPTQENDKDPFGNWDIREPAHRPEPKSTNNASNEFAGVDKPDFNIFNPSEHDTSNGDDNQGEDTPPFFKRRRK